MGLGSLKAGAVFENLLRTQPYFITATPCPLLGHPQPPVWPPHHFSLSAIWREGSGFPGALPCWDWGGMCTDLWLPWWRLACQEFVLGMAEQQPMAPAHLMVAPQNGVGMSVV